MDDEIEDVVGDVKLTESQKSVAMSNVYSMDFTDSGSEKHNSSGMETYVLEWDSEDSESSILQGNVSIVTMKDRPAKPVLINRDAQCEASKKISKASSTSLNKCSIIAQEIFTQTSKTIIELAESEGAVRKPVSCKSLETQTSFISITENKTVEYRIEVSGCIATQKLQTEIRSNDSGDNHQNINCNQLFPNSLDDGSSKFMISETENEKTDGCVSDNSSNEKIINTVNEDILLCDDQNEYDNTSEFEQSPDITDIEDDSLMEPNHRVRNSDNQSNCSITPKSVDNDVVDLYNKLTERINFNIHGLITHSEGPLLGPSDPETKRFGYLTPLTEESVPKKDSSVDVAVANNVPSSNEDDKDVLFINNAGIKVKLFPKVEEKEFENFKLPPIQGNYNSSESGNYNLLFTVQQNRALTKTGNLPSVHEERRERSVDRWEIGTKDLASGESPLISGRTETERISHSTVQLPPIHSDGFVVKSLSKPDQHVANVSKSDILAASESTCPISIREKIKELKMSNKTRSNWSHSKHLHGTSSRSSSPTIVSPDGSRLTDAAERGCELVCVELLKRLRSHSWFEVVDALDDVPRVLDKFWGVVAEHRIADLIRQVTAHVESPRTQLARAACNTLATILKNTNYTKKPDFYEAVTILLIKTGSFSRPVRRAANVALDEIVCGVDLSHAVTALCIHGAGHKSGLVRCAAARLLVVCCALGGGGRDLLRARPPTAATARKHALRSLASLLEDKSSDARKYAERLYSMLRPLANFEAYYLTDVDVDVASKQMKKYDHLLLCGSPEAR